AKEIKAILGDKKKLWKVIRDELTAVAKAFPDKRRTKLGGGGGGDDVEFDPEAFIVDEDATVILSRDGWLKRAREVKDLSATRLREGDAVLAALRGSTKEAVAIFSNLGSAYVMRVNDVPASTGYGEPIQKLFNFRDGERVVGASLMSNAETPKGSRLLAVTKRGFGLRFDPEPHRELSTRAGRRFAKLADGDEIVGVALVPDHANEMLVCAVTSDAHAILCRVSEIPELANPGRGVTVIKTGDGASGSVVMGFGLGTRKDKEMLIIETEAGKEITVGPDLLAVTARGGKGHGLKRKTKIVRVSLPAPPTPPTLLN
ncbi:MAG TPA: DNA gyrase C-terminal beta-propeller domain-containing protein, partial [Polyangia bacterium]|nr:DNA gyrase C-terminal beta-propeller domain-containing protein [Polyangia bacterium]